MTTRPDSTYCVQVCGSHTNLLTLRTSLSKKEAEEYRLVVIADIASGAIGPQVFPHSDGSTYVDTLDQTTVKIVEENGKWL